MTPAYSLFFDKEFFCLVEIKRLKVDTTILPVEKSPLVVDEIINNPGRNRTTDN